MKLNQAEKNKINETQRKTIIEMSSKEKRSFLRKTVRRLRKFYFKGVLWTAKYFTLQLAFLKELEEKVEELEK